MTDDEDTVRLLYRAGVVIATVVGVAAFGVLASELTVTGIRVVNTALGCGAFALMSYRVVGRWLLMSVLSRCVVTLLTLAVLVNGLGAARAAQLHLPFNELAWGAMAVNFAVCVVGLVWQRWLDPTGERT